MSQGTESGIGFRIESSEKSASEFLLNFIFGKTAKVVHFSPNLFSLLSYYIANRKTNFLNIGPLIDRRDCSGEISWLVTSRTLPRKALSEISAFSGQSGGGPAWQGVGLLSRPRGAKIQCPMRTRGFKSPPSRSPFQPDTVSDNLISAKLHKTLPESLFSMKALKFCEA